MTTRTLAMVKPDAHELRVVGRVLSRIEDERFQIVEMRQVTLTRDEAECFYVEHAERAFFKSLIDFMVSGPVTALLLEREGDAVFHWRQVLGATDSRRAAFDTLRGRHGNKTGFAIWRNVAHGSDKPEAVVREMAFFWPTKCPVKTPLGPCPNICEPGLGHCEAHSETEVDFATLATVGDTTFVCAYCDQWYTSYVGKTHVGPCNAPHDEHHWREASGEERTRLRAVAAQPQG
jgi:nucleoside-diphosphate kinase